jgi:hypothetical protein
MEESQGQSSEEVPGALSAPCPSWICFDPRSRSEAHLRPKTSAAGVTEEDRKTLLGHKNGSITSHYSAAELGKLIDEANRISATDSRGPALTILRRMAG